MADVDGADVIEGVAISLTSFRAIQHKDKAR